MFTLILCSPKTRKGVDHDMQTECDCSNWNVSVRSGFWTPFVTFSVRYPGQGQGSFAFLNHSPLLLY